MYKSIKTKSVLTEQFKNSEKNMLKEKVFETSLNEVDNAIKWYENVCKMIMPDIEEGIKKAVLVFSELYMNAYEHGNLAIDTKIKKLYIEKDIYIKKLYEIEQECNAKISVKVYTILNNDVLYIATQICDKGKGFDVFKFIKDNKNITDVNGRGILIALKNCSDVYYNDLGNCAVFLIKKG